MKFKVPYYHERKHDILNNDYSINFDFFKQLSANSMSVIDLTDNPNDAKEINAQLNSRGINTDNIIFLTSNYNIDSADNIIFYPIWLISNNQLLKKIPIDVKRTYKISCLNRIANSHRFYLYYLLKEKQYFNELVYTLQGMYFYGGSASWNDFYDLPKKIKLALSNLDLNVTTVDVPDPNRSSNDHSNNHIAYTDSYMNIITESSYKLTTPFFSEKTIKPLASGQLFLMAGDQNSINSLRALGFETFDNVFNSHTYDNLSNYKQRIDSMVELVDSIYENIESIYFDNISAIKHNQDYALSDAFRNSFLKPLLDLDIIDQ